MPAMRLDSLTKHYTRASQVVRALDGVSLEIEQGEFVAVVGRSGSGKTTMLDCAGLLMRPTAGRVLLDGIDSGTLSERERAELRSRRIGFIFQEFNLLPTLSAMENVLLPLRYSGADRRAGRRRAEQLLEEMGLADRASHRPAELSGGQQQRVAIARALVHDPPLILADEPTAHLDHIQVEGILRLMRDLASPGRIIVVSTHDDRVSQLADRVIELAPHFSDADRQPEEVHLADGEILFRQGERGELIFHVESGLLEVYRELADGGEEVLAQVKPGNYVGELGPILNLPRSASVRAMGEAFVIGYTVRAFRKEHPHHLADQIAT
jgi:putative ABC transport system ATP-binding protein